MFSKDSFPTNLKIIKTLAKVVIAIALSIIAYKIGNLHITLTLQNPEQIKILSIPNIENKQLNSTQTVALTQPNQTSIQPQLKKVKQQDQSFQIKTKQEKIYLNKNNENLKVTPDQIDQKEVKITTSNIPAKTHTVELLNNSPDGAMVFSPGFIKINTGDSINFKPTSFGHNVQTPEEIINSNDAIPEGAKTWKSNMNEEITIKFTVPGIYLYICNYHYIVGHVGVIQVGNNKNNLDNIIKASTILKSKMFANSDRLDKYLKNI